MQFISELLIGEKVLHKVWNEGVIIDIDCNHMVVEFENKSAVFQYPQAIGSFLTLVDIPKYEKKYSDYACEEKINFILQRDIKYFVHFTRLENVDSIIKKGLVPVSTLKLDGTDFCHNDKDRFDGHLDANSLSISFPNYQMFFRYRNANPETKWAVICFDAGKIVREDCAYFYRNAASKEFISKDWSLFTSIEALKEMFSGDRDDLSDFETTDPQAEVMVKGIIPTESISRIVLNDMDSLKEYTQKYTEFDFVLRHDYFQVRSDYKRWSKNGK